MIKFQELSKNKEEAKTFCQMVSFCIQIYTEAKRRGKKMEKFMLTRKDIYETTKRQIIFFFLNRRHKEIDSFKKNMSQTQRFENIISLYDEYKVKR